MKRKSLIMSLMIILILIFISFLLILSKIKEAQDTEKYVDLKYHFALYYADKSAPENKKMFTKKKFNINKVTLEKEAFLTENDIINYDWSKHQIWISKHITLKTGEGPFFLLINGKRIYEGFIDSPMYSVRPPGNIYLTDINATDEKYILTLVPYRDKDEGMKLLNDKAIYDALKETGKLKE